MFALMYLKKKIISNPHVNIANPIKINKVTTIDLKSIMSTYCGLSKWCVDSVFVSQLQDLISLGLSSNTKTIVFTHI